MSSEAKILLSNREFCSEILKAPDIKKFEMDKTDSVLERSSSLQRIKFVIEAV